jgi:hypothetical protein
MGPRFSTFSANMTRSTGPLLACALALLSAQANAQAGATPPNSAHLDQQSPTGRLMFQITGAFAEFERSMIRQRVRAGLKRGYGLGD